MDTFVMVFAHFFGFPSLYRVYQEKVDPFKFKSANCDCVKTQGFVLMGQNNFKIYMWYFNR